LRQVLAQGKPFLGICLGYQVLFQHSDENDTVCLGLLPGKVRRFPDPLLEAGNPRPLKVPQMGWNQLAFTRQHPVWAGVPAGSEFYIVHSYFPEVPDAAMIAATTDYGVTFTSGVAWQTLVAFQCHPEKSGAPGLKMLDNFCRWRP
jgi:glutamine amidotransferase